MIYGMRSLVVLILIGFSALSALAQGGTNVISGQDEVLRPITPAVPFLLISPDARSGAMGDAGAALSPDANSNHWNIGKLAFIDTDYGVSLSYIPWLAKLFGDMDIANLVGYYKIDDVQAVSASMRYFNMGTILFTDYLGAQSAPEFRPQEVAVDVSYSRKLSEKLGLGVTARFINSDLAGEGSVNNLDATPGRSLAADVGAYYNTDLVVNGTESELAFAAVISNIGNKITYLNEDQESFIPTNLRLGTAYTAQLDPYNSLTIALDFNKLMIPTPPIYATDARGVLERDQDGRPVIAENGGLDPDRSFINGIFTSFYDAPGGFSEELKEITISTGIEYWYNDLFAARAGYFYEHLQKGNRKFFTLGAGLRYQLLTLDFAYLVPQEQQHPLAETLRFTLGINFEKSAQANN